MEEILRTSRLWLRPLTPEDTDSLCQIMQDPEAMTAYERCYSRQEVQQWIARNQKRYQTDGAGLWAVILTESGILIGQCGLVWQQEAGMAFWEVGYLFNRQYWHQGYATEAAMACRDYAFAHLKAPAVYSIIKHNHLPSQRVAERCGMTRWRTLHFGGAKLQLQDTLHYLYRVENPAQP